MAGFALSTEASMASVVATQRYRPFDCGGIH
jgi:hypothetical protein